MTIRILTASIAHKYHSDHDYDYFHVLTVAMCEANSEACIITRLIYIISSTDNSQGANYMGSSSYGQDETYVYQC